MSFFPKKSNFYDSFPLMSMNSSTVVGVVVVVIAAAAIYALLPWSWSFQVMKH